MLIDVHCHLNEPEFEKDLDDVISRALKAGVVKIIDCGLGPSKIIRSLEISGKYKGIVYTSTGLEPYNLNERDFNNVIELIEKFSDMIVAIGEVGLDYYYVRELNSRLVQKERFLKFIELAKELDLPLVIHSRSAGKYALSIIMESNAERVLFHAFDGSAKYAVRGAKHGFYFSIPPSVVRSRQKQLLVEKVPLENLMTESDSPVLGPNPRERNEPCNVTISARKIAEIKGVEYDDVVKATYKNALNLFTRVK